MFSNQLSRTALLYLLASFVACNALLVNFLPWWLFAVAAICAVWRMLIFSGRASFPVLWMKVGLVFLSGAALFWQYRFAVSLNVFVTLLILGFSLKLLEIYQKQDAQFLLYLSLFVLMTVFLFSQMVGYTVLVFAAVVLVLSSLVAVHSDEVVLQATAWQPLRRGAWIFLAALPVMLFMFVVMPRFPPLWSMPLQAQQAKTGMSDSMSPGDIANLAQSSEIAFRASFPSGVPPRQSLYWYGLFLDQFDGVSWSQSCKQCLDFFSDALSKNNSMSYQVVLEPSGQPWVYLLHPAAINDTRMKRKPDGVVRYADNVAERRIYSAALLSSPAKKILSRAERTQYLVLPNIGNSQARQLAQTWRQQSNRDEIVVQKALDFYHASFHYTLQPPLLRGDRIDDFLFNTRSGFCEHFSSSFVFLMRAAGIPARVAVGYMGGEVDAKKGFVVVRQYDAHAWAEVWLADKGWQRVDPTAAVAPERIDLGFAGAYESNAAFAGSAGILQLRRFSLLNRIRLNFDHFDYLWSRWVLGYRDEQQSAFLQKLGLLMPWRIAVWSAVGVAFAFLLLCVWLYWRERDRAHEQPATRSYRKLCRAYARLGFARDMSETPLQYAERIRAAGAPYAEQFAALSLAYHVGLYEGDSEKSTTPSRHFAAECRHLVWWLCWCGFNQRRGDKS